jgi:hypothetical protein
LQDGDRPNSKASTTFGFQIDGGLRVPVLTRLALAAAVLAGLSATGCGSAAEGTTDAPPAATLTKVEFLAKANTICKRANQRQDAVAQREFGVKQPTPAKIMRFAKRTAIPGIGSQVEELRALGAPSPTVTRLLEIAELDLTSVKIHPALLTSDRDPFANFRRLAHSYGLTSCAP